MDVSMKNGLLRLIFIYLYGIFRLTGLLPFEYNFKTQRFDASSIALVYSTAYSIFLGIYHPISTDYYIHIIQETEMTRHDMRITHFFNNTLNILIVSFYLINISQHRALRKTLNSIIVLYRVVNKHLPSDAVKTSDWLMFNILQMCFTHFVYLVIFLNFRYTLTDITAWNLFYGLVTILPYWYWNLFLNLYTNCSTVLLLLQRQVNWSVEKSLQPFLVDRLQMALSAHRQIIDLLRLMVTSMSYFLAFIMAQMFCCTVYEVYYQYAHLVYVVVFSHPVAPQIIAGGFSILPLFCCIVVMPITICVKCVAESRKLIWLINGVGSMDNYLTYMAHETWRITVYNMFDVNFEIVFMFFTTALSYVIILVQFNITDYMYTARNNHNGGEIVN